MKPLYNINGLIFWNDEQIAIRDLFKNHFFRRISKELLKTNAAWKFFQVDAPLITPRINLNQNYTEEDIWTLNKDLALRPETTPGSYIYADHLIDMENIRPPMVVWQAGKSFRLEQDQVQKNMRLKEFYQQEFQCIYAEDTKNDYQSIMAEKMLQITKELIHLPVRLIDSDRLPSYSLKTVDIEVNNGDKWMEIASISVRTDFTKSVSFNTKTNAKKCLVLEIAIGLDRCVYNYEIARDIK